MTLSVHRSQSNMVGWTYLDLHVPPDSCFFIQGLLSLSAASVPMVMLYTETFPQAQRGWLWVISFSMNSARSQMSKPPEMNFVFGGIGKHPHTPITLVAAFRTCPPKPKERAAGSSSPLWKLVSRKVCLPSIDSSLEGLNVGRTNPSYYQNWAYWYQW